VDLWPVFADLPERQKAFQVSKPWAKISYELIFLESAPIPDKEYMQGKKMAVATRLSSDARMAEQFLNGARVVPKSNVAADGWRRCVRGRSKPACSRRIRSPIPIRQSARLDLWASRSSRGLIFPWESAPAGAMAELCGRLSD